ncbi:PEBP-like protein, partial [Aureobasidium melanogenum]
MKPSQVLLAVAAAGVNLASAATPPGSTPQVANTLGIQFGKNNVQPGEMIDQLVADAGQPTLYAPSPKLNNRNLAKHKSSKNDKTYIFTMVDLDLPFFALPNTTDFASLVPGIGPNRTTRLHWFEYNVHAIPPHQTLQNFSTPIADYEGPQPPQGDEPHNYVIYLFEQPEGYKPDLSAAATYANFSYLGRMNYSIKALEDQIGAPIAANYFLVENENNTKSS